MRNNAAQMKTLRKVKIEGFKSIERAELELGDLNVVIGANGSGKSNLLGAFRLLERVLSGRLQQFVANNPPDRLLHHGRKITPALSLDVEIDDHYSYGFKLRAAQDRLVLENEGPYPNGLRLAGHPESVLEVITERQLRQDFPQAKNVNDFLAKVSNLVVYHFDDTLDSSPAKNTCDVDDNRFFRHDAANLPAYLYWLQEKHPLQFRHIEEHIRLVAPFFERFVLAPLKHNERTIKLEWRHKGSDAYFDAWSLSDGTLRFICLATLLLQPEPPALILLDEPELGLHPLAIRILSEMVESVAKQSQVLLATQSVTLLDNFAPKDVIVAENDGLKTSFKRLDEEKLKVWLDDFSIGELWEKNVLGGNP